jgi:hypothetical protein
VGGCVLKFGDSLLGQQIELTEFPQESPAVVGMQLPSIYVISFGFGQLPLGRGWQYNWPDVQLCGVVVVGVGGVFGGVGGVFGGVGGVFGGVGGVFGGVDGH